MASWKNQKIADVASGFLWWITYGGLQEPVDILAPKGKQQAAITYHWKYKQWAVLMKNELERIGYNVWIDLNWSDNGGKPVFDSFHSKKQCIV